MSDQFTSVRTFWINNWGRFWCLTSLHLSKLVSTTRYLQGLLNSFLDMVYVMCIRNTSLFLRKISYSFWVYNVCLTKNIHSSIRYNNYGSPSKNHEKSFSNVYLLVSKDCFSRGPLSFSLNPQLWCFKLLWVTMTLAHLLVESAMKRTIHWKSFKGLLKETKTYYATNSVGNWIQMVFEP